MVRALKLLVDKEDMSEAEALQLALKQGHTPQCAKRATAQPCAEYGLALGLTIVLPPQSELLKQQATLVHG